jgi:hypothetical protein
MGTRMTLMKRILADKTKEDQRKSASSASSAFPLTRSLVNHPGFKSITWTEQLL